MRKALYILGDLNDDDIRWLASAGAVRTFENGDILVYAGRRVTELFIIVDGEISVRLRDGGGEIARMAVGDIVGEMSLIEKRPPEVGVVAVGPVRALCIPQQTLLGRLGTDSGFAARFYRALAVFLSDRLRDNVARLGARIATDPGAPAPEPSEVDEGLLDTLHVAGARMRRLLALLEGRDL